jgi:tetratricopeptide (TPR) repeat protein
MRLVEFYQQRGRKSADQQDYAAARADYTRAMELQPDNSAIYTKRGEAYFYLDNFSAALADVNRAIELDPDDGDAYACRGTGYYSIRNYVAAITDLSRAIERHPKEGENYSWRGMAYLAQEDYPAALADFSGAIELQPQDGANYLLRGRTYLAQRDYPAALADLSRGISALLRNGIRSLSAFSRSMSAMNTSPVTSEKHRLDSSTGSPLAQSIGGLAAIILAILGLFDICSHYMLAIAALMIGAALVFQGGTISMEYSNLLSRTSHTKLENAPVGGAMSIEVLAGVAGIVLGVLALVTVSPDVLLPVAVIVFGVALIGGSGEATRLHSLKLKQSGADGRLQQIARESLSVGTSTQVLIGLGGVVLGILALIGYDWTVLTVVALLAFGIAVLRGSTAVLKRMTTLFHA